MEPTIHIVDEVVDSFLVPLIASGRVDLDYVVKRLKRKLADYLEEEGATRDVVARHLGKTSRSLYRWQDDSPEHAQSMQRLLRTCLELLGGAFPHPLLVSELRLKLEEHRIWVGEEELPQLLRLYQTFELVIVDRGDAGTLRVRAAEDFFRVSGDPDRLGKARERTREALDLMVSYAEEAAGAGVLPIYGEWTEGAYQSFCEDLCDYAAERAGRAHQQSLRESAEGATSRRFRVLLAWRLLKK